MITSVVAETTLEYASAYSCRVHADNGSADTQEILAGLIDILTALKRRAGEREDPATVFLLRHLRDSPPRRISELADCSRLDVSTVSRHVKSLEEAGHVDRIEDPEDRRASRVLITQQGEALYDAAMAARSAALDRVLSGWSDRDRRALTRLVARLAGDVAAPALTRAAR